MWIIKTHLGDQDVVIDIFILHNMILQKKIKLLILGTFSAYGYSRYVKLE